MKKRVTMDDVRRTILKKMTSGIPETDLVRNMKDVAALIRQLRYVRHRAYSLIENVLLKVMLNGITKENREAAREIVEEFGKGVPTSQKALLRYYKKYG